MTEILAVDKWTTNGHLIADCARLGYLNKNWDTLDCTFGLGVFWSFWRPDILIASDLDPAKSPIGTSVDFTNLPWSDKSFMAVVFDPPYKLNGTPDGAVDHRYGVHVPTNWKERHALIRRGISECARVLADGGHLLLKCQDQVCSGKVRWQTIEFTEHAESCGLGILERFDYLGGRPQPDGRRQVHARRNYSSLLIFKRGWWSSDLPKPKPQPDTNSEGAPA